MFESTSTVPLELSLILLTQCIADAVACSSEHVGFSTIWVRSIPQHGTRPSGHDLFIFLAPHLALRDHGSAAWLRRRTPQVAPPEAVTIPVSKPVVREVTDFVDFTGRTDAIQSVDIRPRTTGYLVRMPFEEGANQGG